MTRWVALLAASAAALATSWEGRDELRAPCVSAGSSNVWDANVPLLMVWKGHGDVPTDANLRDAIELETEDGEPIPFVTASPEAGVVHVCAVGGLPLDTDIVWRVRQFANRDTNHLPVPYWGSTGVVRFRVSPASEHPEILDERDCATFDGWGPELDMCGREPGRDTGFR